MKKIIVQFLIYRKEVLIMANWLKILLQAIAAAIGAILGTGVF